MGRLERRVVPAAARRVADLGGPERRLLDMLRRWPDDPQGVWDDLAAALGPARARACLRAFEDVRALLRHSAWQLAEPAPPGSPDLTPDEADLCALVMAAAQGRRDEALSRGLFMVREAALLPLVHAASRLGLPLLCGECRARLHQALRRH
ncbi:hypothetical protein [Roseivivax sp. CAU 1761]